VGAQEGEVDDMPAPVNPLMPGQKPKGDVQIKDDKLADKKDNEYGSYIHGVRLCNI